MGIDLGKPSPYVRAAVPEKREQTGDIGFVIQNAKKTLAEERRKEIVKKKKQYDSKRKYLQKQKILTGHLSKPRSTKLTPMDWRTPAGKKAIQVVISRDNSKVYSDSVVFAPRAVFGQARFGHESMRNAFDMLNDFQCQVKEHNGQRLDEAPEWIVIQTSKDIILDRNIVARLKELNDTTGAACAFGYDRINMDGNMWFYPSPNTANYSRGYYVQGNENNIEWNHVFGTDPKNSKKYRILIGAGPFIAIRGRIFYQINFEELTREFYSGFCHLLPTLSMEIWKLGSPIAQISTLSMQFDNNERHIDDDEFIMDHEVFMKRYGKYFPLTIMDKFLK